MTVQTPEEAEALSRWLMRKRALAAENVIDFFEFVMREEFTRAPIKLAPHQRIGLDFIMRHDRCVNMWPINHSKTWISAGLSLFLLGKNPTLRGAIVSARQGQAMKPLSLVRAEIEENPHLRMVFPNLRPTQRPGEPWTQHAITIDRPAGIRDPSLIALGIGGGIPGARLNWIIVDDILDAENTATKEQRDKVYTWFDSSVLSRLDPRNARIIVTNTAWHPDDICHRLRDQGWPTMRMDADTGEIEVWAPLQEQADGSFAPDPWGDDGDPIAEYIRPASDTAFVQFSDGAWRAKLAITSHDTLPMGDRTLWPAKFDRRWVERKRREHLPRQFNQLLRNICRDDDSSRCKEEWIDQCKKAARERGHHDLVHEYKGSNLTFTGVDLAISPGEEHDDTAFFTFEVLPSGHRLILDVEVGQYDGPTIVEKIIDKAKRYNSIVRVENNGAQEFIRQFALQRDAALPIKPHTTGRSKAHPEHGVEGLFVELYNSAWLIPTGRNNQVHPMVQKWIDACLYYSPTKHTDDVLMACYFAREQAREWGVLSGGATASVDSGGIASNIMSR